MGHAVKPPPLPFLCSLPHRHILAEDHTGKRTCAFLVFRHCQGGRLEVPGGMPHLQHVFPRMPLVLQIQHTLAHLMFGVTSCQCVPPSGRVCAGCWADQGSTGPGHSQFSFSHVCGTSLQCSRQSVTPSPSALCPSQQDLSLTILGLAIATSTISTGEPKAPHTEGSTDSGFRAAPHVICSV